MRLAGPPTERRRVLVYGMRRWRAALAADVVTTRLAGTPLRAEVLGGPTDCRLRVAAISHDRDLLDRIGDEVESLYTNGPAGGGGAWKSARHVVAVASALVARDLARPAVRYEVA